VVQGINKNEEKWNISLNKDYKGICLFSIIAVFGILADLTSKSFIFEWLKEKPFYSYPVIDGFFNLVMVENPGAAFGIAHGQRWILTGVSIIGLIIVLAVVFLSDKHHKIMYVVLGLLCAGITGNLYDRIFNNGRVRDFIDIIYWKGKHWPAFNIADSMLCIAVALVFILTFFSETPCRKQTPPRKEEPSKQHREQ
jgi:signal peptidase II